MSLGSPTMAGQRYSVVFENAARRAMEAGTLIVAAAGNDSRRDLGIVNPVSHPANCPSIMAVGAVDAQFRVASFSNGGINPNGGEVDIAGPGVEVRSSWPMPAKYRTISGTSMATPHVAGALALFKEANPQAAGADLWSLLARAARPLLLQASDVGPGLVQGP
jgi:subtilisin family serine protease